MQQHTMDPGPAGIDAPALPRSACHQPVLLLNRRREGLRTRVACSCGSTPAAAAGRVEDLTAWHIAHRGELGLRPADYELMVYGEGPATGWTWGDWQLLHPDLDPFGIR